MKNLAISLAAALAIAIPLTGCGSDSTPALTYVARGSSDNYAPHLFTLNPTTQKSTAVSIPIPTDAEYVSSNGTATAVTYCRESDGPPDIYEMGTDGVEHQLTTGADACESVFSPDGKTIAYVSFPSDGDFGIYTMNVDGTNQQMLFDGGGFVTFFPEFSPDGKSLVFFYGEGGPDARHRQNSARRTPLVPFGDRPLQTGTRQSVRRQADPIASGWYTMALTDTAPTLVYAAEYVGPAVFSANGKQLLLTMYDEDDDGINISSVNLDGTGFTALTTSTTAENFAPVAYNSVILFNTYDDANSSDDIMLMDATGANPAQVLSTDNEYDLLVDAYYYPINY